MKLIVRTFVVVLALSGASASTHFAASAPQNAGQGIAPKTSALPIPVCPPDDPNGCKKM